MTLERVSFNVESIFDDIATFFRERSAASEAELRFERDADSPAGLVGDPRRLLQIFINLVENAFKFTEKGSITLRAALVEHKNSDIVLRFTVEDTGIGMSEEQLNVIFSAFNQADNSSTRKYGGAGIGLTVTRRMVELMGGEISVASAPGKGTAFTFTCAFSLAPAGADAVSWEAEASDAAADPQNTVLRGKRILLVEDNEINTLIAEELLTAVGVEVTTAQNGSEALDRLKEATGTGALPFDMVLMDLQMPVMDGYEATEIIRATPEYRGLPIYALTAHAFPEDRERCLSIGMDGHLTKPIDTDLFYAALRTAVTTG
jgi:CheY-like chemotaxis protein